MVTEIKASTVLTGLTAEEIAQSRARYGDNALEAKGRKHFFRAFLSNLSDPIIRVLLIALCVNVVLLFRDINWFETGGILLAVLLSSLVSTISEWGSERAFEKLRDSAGTATVRVRRAGGVQEISARDLVVGDLYLLSSGDLIQADAVLLDGTLTVDQSALNGEGTEAEKRPGVGGKWELSDTRHLFRGSIVSTGEGLARVERVGQQSMYGSLAGELQSETRDSPLKLRLSHLAGQISRLGYVMAALIALAYCFSAFVLDAGFEGTKILALLADRRYVLATLTHTISLVITVIVVAVPEGLPMMITVVLSSNMKRMLRAGVLVRKMVGIETAGSLNILFTDKTGTLTAGKMNMIGVSAAGGATFRSLAALNAVPAIRDALIASARLNTDCVWSDGRAIGGNATDRAILTWFGGGTETGRVSQRLKFDSARKYAAVRVGSVTHLRGAPDYLLPAVHAYLGADGNTYPYDRATARSTENALYRAALRGERLIAVCISENPIGEGSLPPLTLVGILSLRDRVRREAPQAVRSLHRAGVQIVMVTGDGRGTAVSVALESGLIAAEDAGGILSGEEIRALDDDALRARISTLRVVFRATPTDKSRLVRAAQALGMVTGMTGDGINDAPSLKIADVGFSMGSGTDIAKEAGDIVILDDNIASIARTVLFGRTIFSSIRKFITFQLTMNLCAVGVSLIGQFIGLENPITIMQMLWVNIIMDTLGGLAFAGEPPLESYMREKPKKRTEPILSSQMIHQILIDGLFTLALCVWFLLSPHCAVYFGRAGDPTYFLTAFFALFIFAGIANSFCARTARIGLLANLSRNRPFLFIMVLISCVQILMIYYGGALFRTTPLLPADLAWVILLSLTVIPVDFIRKVLGHLVSGNRQKRV